MRRRKRNSFARIGLICVALLVALGVMGMGYGMWSDTASIITTVNVGATTTELSYTGCSPEVTSR